jgi:3-hydroxymyristoyl/3-hydroxydecanoyl-(acyl carrier protein) dehydratase
LSPSDVLALVKDLRKRPLDMAGATVQSVEYGRAAIERILPHRDPLLFVDAITAVDLKNQRIKGKFLPRHDDPTFRGHFPSDPVYPGAFQIEAMGQLGLCLAHFVTKNTTAISSDAHPVPVRALRVHHAQYIDAVLPGDEIETYAALLEEDGMTATCAGQMVKGGRVVSLAIQEVYFVE